MKQSEFKRWLAKQGATFEEGGKHTKVFLNGKQTAMPRHPAHEIGPVLQKLIKKQLEIK